MATREEVLANLSIRSFGDEKIVSYPVSYDSEPSQIAFQEESGVMLVDFSNENLIENCEFPEGVARDLQEHQEAVIDWIKAQGFEVNIQQ